jgi:hypothetical protein
MRARVGVQIAGYNHATARDAAIAELLAGTPEVVNVRSFGAVGDGVTDDTVAFEAACIAADGGQVVIPFNAMLVTGPADAAGCSIVGNGSTVISGYFKGATSVSGVTIGGVPQQYAAQHPTIPFDLTPKAIRYIDANTFHLVTQNPNRGYSLVVLKNNITTPSGSLATTSSDTTQFRVTGFLHLVECLTGYLTASAESGVWTTASVSAGVPTFTAGDYYNLTQSSTIGAYKDFTITVPEDGFFSVTFLRSSGASTDVDVLVDSVAIDTAIDLSGSTSRYTKKYTTTPGAHTVRVVNNTVGSTTLAIVGLNFAPMRSQRTDVSVDTLGYYRNDTSFISPINTNSANDYAFRDDVSGTYGGSYHGGEGTITRSILVDGVDTNVTAMNLGSSIEIIQTSVVTWPGDGPSVDVMTRHIGHIGGYSLAMTFAGSITAREYYTTLVGLNENYTHVAFPELVPFSGLSDGQRYSLGQGNAVEYRSSATGQRFRITHSTYTQMENRYGGAFIWKVVGTYLKYYNAYIHSGSRAVDSLSAVVTLQAS